jgi:hypothetical protein
MLEMLRTMLLFHYKLKYDNVIYERIKVGVF